MEAKNSILGPVALLFWATAAIAQVARAQPAPGGGPSLVKAQFIADTDVIVPGKPFTLGVMFDIAPNWHVYWTNPGDSGLPTEIAWKLPNGLTTGVTRYPVPVRFTQPGDIVGYGYTTRVLLTTTVTPASDLVPGTQMDLTANVRWLVCEKVCVPGKAKLSLPISVGSKSVSANAEMFSEFSARWPQQLSDDGPMKLVSATFDPAASVTTVQVHFDEKPAVASVDFFPGPSDAVEIRKVQVERAGTNWTLRLPVKLEAGADSARTLFGLVVYTTEAGDRIGVRVEVPIK